MKHIILPSLFCLLMLFACGQPDKTVTTNEPLHEAVVMEMDSVTIGFWNNLSALCGRAFEGRLLTAPTNDDFAGKQLIMHVRHCGTDTIMIPFNVGDNRSRTWIFTKQGNRIELKHDHRHEDGSHDAVTMYGGTSTNAGTANAQVFPADQQTRTIIPEAFSNVWWVTVSDSAYTYNLRRLNTERIFTVSFDLTKPVAFPEPSWGWE